jgi:hypothetical protein
VGRPSRTHRTHGTHGLQRTTFLPTFFPFFFFFFFFPLQQHASPLRVFQNGGTPVGHEWTVHRRQLRTDGGSFGGTGGSKRGRVVQKTQQQRVPVPDGTEISNLGFVFGMPQGQSSDIDRAGLARHFPPVPLVLRRPKQHGGFGGGVAQPQHFHFVFQPIQKCRVHVPALVQICFQTFDFVAQNGHSSAAAGGGGCQQGVALFGQPQPHGGVVQEFIKQCTGIVWFHEFAGFGGDRHQLTGARGFTEPGTGFVHDYPRLGWVVVLPGRRRSCGVLSGGGVRLWWMNGLPWLLLRLLGRWKRIRGMDWIVPLLWVRRYFYVGPQGSHGRE